LDNKRLKLYSWCGERLEEHLYETFKLYELNFEDRVLKILEGRLNNIFDDFSKLILRLTPLLHDIGKSYPGYQEKVREKCPFPGYKKCRECADKPNFSWHEVLSAYLYWELTERLIFNCGLERFHEDLQVISAISILTHHQAMREPLTERPRKDVNLKKWEVETVSDLMFKLTDLACNGLRIDNSLLKENVEEVLRMVDIDIKKRNHGLINLCEMLERILYEKVHCKTKIYSVVAGSLVMCDWLAAKKLRKTTFIHPMLSEIMYSFPELKNL